MGCKYFLIAQEELNILFCACQWDLYFRYVNIPTGFHFMENQKMLQGATGKILLRGRNNLAHVTIVSSKTGGVFKYWFYIKFSRKMEMEGRPLISEDLLSWCLFVVSSRQELASNLTQFVWRFDTPSCNEQNIQDKWEEYLLPSTVLTCC